MKQLSQGRQKWAKFGAIAAFGIVFATASPVFAAPGGQGQGQGASAAQGEQRGPGGPGAQGGQHGAHGVPFAEVFLHAPDETRLAQQIEQCLSRILTDISAAQKTAIQALAKAAYTDLKTLREQHKAAREAAPALFTAATLNRTAIEQNRAEQLRLADLISKRETQAVADIMDALTAAQRTKLAEKRNGGQQAAQAAALKSPFGK